MWHLAIFSRLLGKIRKVATRLVRSSNNSLKYLNKSLGDEHFQNARVYFILVFDAVKLARQHWFATLYSRFRPARLALDSNSALLNTARKLVAVCLWPWCPNCASSTALLAADLPYVESPSAYDATALTFVLTTPIKSCSNS